MSLVWSDRPAVAAHISLLVLQALPLFVHVPTPLNIVVTASLTVYAGCWRSVKATPPAEQMTKKDALRFPIVGSFVLLSLFLAFKFLPKHLVNALLACYLGVIAVLVSTSAMVPYVQSYLPESFRNKQLQLPNIKIPFLKSKDPTEEPIFVSYPELLCGFFSCCFCGWYFYKKHWIANNLLGLAFSLEGIEQLSLGSVHVGTILLVGLFFYDIFWVFCTPVMVSVAKNFDAPIKLLFPRLPDVVGGKRPFAMLGLGDIVIPGMFVALILRYDVAQNFATSYFQSAFGGYILGLTTTIAVMHYFNAAQPALLYIVPAVLGAVFIHALIRGEFQQLFDYAEEKPKDGDHAEHVKSPEEKKTQ